MNDVELLYADISERFEIVRYQSIVFFSAVPAAVRSRLLRLRSLWDEIRQRAEEREGKLQDVLDLAGKFWADMAALLSTLRDSQEIVKELEDPGVDPSLIKQQIEAAEVRICILHSKGGNTDIFISFCFVVTGTA